MTDAIQDGIQYALHGLADRRRVSDNNIANLSTPGFLASSTNFESSLEQAMTGKSVAMNPKHLTSTAATNTNGNNVNLDNETVTAMDTELRYQAMIGAMTTKFQILRSSIG